ncbi:hypothetical protein [Capnocytophaga canimorsus]|uniref:hypothetical protein n=1 Tax=Capnocytophaga canimorsus TaxID=28188 RepID=UPI00385BFDA7
MVKTKNQPKKVKTTKLGVTKGKKVVNDSKIYSASSIKALFTKHIKEYSENFSDWYCGITNSEKRRNSEHLRKYKKIYDWKCYTVKNVEEANEIEKYFNEKGTLNASNMGHTTIKTNKVYIFRLDQKTKKQHGLGMPVNIDGILNIFFKIEE